MNGTFIDQAFLVAETERRLRTAQLEREQLMAQRIAADSAAATGATLSVPERIRELLSKAWPASPLRDRPAAR